MYLYIRIFSNMNIRLYHIRIIFLIRIYSDIRLYCFFYTNIFGYSFVSFFYTNIFGYSFVSFFGYKYIRIFVCIENLYSPHPALKVLLKIRFCKLKKKLIRYYVTYNQCDCANLRAGSLRRQMKTKRAAFTCFALNQFSVGS